MKNLKSIDIPNSPGVYKFLNSDNKILYVGKSKNLKKRVKSYFQKEQNKKNELVQEVKQLEIYNSILKKFPDATLKDVIMEIKKKITE